MSIYAVQPSLYRVQFEKNGEPWVRTGQVIILNTFQQMTIMSAYSDKNKASGQKAIISQIKHSVFNETVKSLMIPVCTK